MRSIFSKILLWMLGTTVVSLAGFGLTTWLVSASQPERINLIGRMQALQLEGARQAYDEGGPEQLARYLRRVNELFEAEHFLVTPAGKDLVDGQDRSALLANASTAPRPPMPHGGRLVLASPPTDGGPRLLVSIHPRFAPGNFVLYYLWILVVVVGLGYALAVHLARPLRGLRLAVERFGQGDLSARIGSTRSDEIGELARAFDQMAERLTTLMTAQRRFLQDVSHELRSPLARLALAVRLARSSDDRTAALDRVKKDVDRLSRLVDELVQLTAAEGDPRTRNDEEVPLHELLETLVDDCALEAEATGCRVTFRRDGPAVLVGDRELIRRAFENVLRNAVRYAPAGTVVEVELRSAPDTATITVRDYGTGVPEEALAAIFEPFFRVGEDRSRSGGGVGLGLSIARRAVELHGGRISARNAGPGLGVTIELPTVHES
ncbi:MAG: ATP-binding protein [Isosphaeraceae bacterium]|nr:ATP-binding protein [Isosphaeraceae bacterium]